MNSIEIDFVYGVIGGILLRVWNTHETYLNWIFGFILSLFSSQLLFFYVSDISGQIVWVISAFGLSTTYYLRFKDKPEKGIIDYLKLPALILLIIYPLTFYSIFRIGDETYGWEILRSFTFPFLGTIYIYDRWILKPEKMKKKYIIVLVVQSFLILIMFVFALFQKSEADHQRRNAVSERMRAEKIYMELEAEIRKSRQ